MKPIIFFLFCFLASSQLRGRASDESGRSQIAVENKSARSLARQFVFYEATYPGTKITNVLQIMGPNLQELIPWEDSLRERFGTNAGFQNSILEKYVLVPPGLIVKDGRGEIVLTSAEPFPDEKGELCRAVVTRSPGDYLGFILSENRIQRLFAETGLEISKAELTEPIPRPPPEKNPLPQTLEESLKMFPEMAAQMGLNTNKPLPQSKKELRPPAQISSTNDTEHGASVEPTNSNGLLIGLILTGTAALGIYFWRRGHIVRKK